MNENYEKIDYLGSTIEQVVNSLFIFKKQGKLVYTEYNGITLYSDTVTMDDAYKSITGKTKAECDKVHQDWINEYNRQEKEHQEVIPSLTEIWKQKGKEILSEDKLEYWDKIVPIRLGDLYHGMELGCCLDIVKILNNGGTLDEAKAMIESQNHSGMSYGLVCSMVREFCDRGQEFVVYVR